MLLIEPVGVRETKIERELRKLNKCKWALVCGKFRSDQTMPANISARERNNERYPEDEKNRNEIKKIDFRMVQMEK